MRSSRIERLEELLMLNASPIARDDLAYSTPQDTALVVTSANSLLNNDWVPEGSSMTASVVANPASGTISNFSGSAAQVQSALEALSTVGTGNVAVAKLQDQTWAQEWRLTFQNGKGGTNVVQTTVDSTNIVGMGSPTNIQATDTQGGQYDEVQTVTVTNAGGGTFRLAYNGQTTAPMASDASAATVESTLEALYAVD